MFDDYSPKGVKFILVVGKDGTNQPATPSYAKQYAIDKGYQDGWVVVADPAYVGMNERILDNYGAIPFHAILAKDAILRVVSADHQFVWTPEVGLINILKEQGLYP